MLSRREYLLRGVVQGVGFRPHAASVAARHSITGFVGNDDRQVFIEAQGTPESLDAFIAEVLANLPPLATVIAVSSTDLPTITETGFSIAPSRHLHGARSLIPPDVATCADCLAEMRDPANRRYGYAFTTCTNCGPRLTIIEDLPYDRPATTMRAFEMCPACAAEYTNPADRRHHAQPISCFDCGPTLWLVDAKDAATSRPAQASTPESQGAIVAEAKRRLTTGQILAVKGLGGFHLMCDARNVDAVTKLRERKRRSGKPFAVMVADLEAARSLADLSDGQAAALASPARPILIAPMAPGYDLAAEVAPGLTDLGVMLPYAPLHHLLLESGLALVATSGNLSDEPLCFTNADAFDRLAHLADAFLLHDRDIHVPVEDSVLLAVGTGTLPIRRSRGFAPLPVALPPPLTGPVVLGVGGELKNTFTLALDDLAFVSAHIGDMGSLAAQQGFEASVAQMLNIQRREPEVVVCDLHPGYATTAWAERYVDAHPGVQLIRVQHHYAHALALVAEHGIASGPVVVAALDGTGYGSDGSIWGGEILTLGAGGTSLANWERTWQVPAFALVGGDRAIRHPWRIAQGLAHSWGLDVSATPATSRAPEAELRLVRSQLESGTGVVATSSAGRLFDAAAAILGLCLEATYEAHAAMALERAASDWTRTAAISTLRQAQATEPTQTLRQAQATEPTQTLRPGSLVAVLDELLANPQRPTGERAWRFHLGLASVFADQLAAAATAANTATVGLTGGVVANRLFASALTADLEGRGLTVLTHSVVPPTDGGLSLGQAWAGRLLAP